ncbi:gamma-glutamylcyclotransferase family protein [Plesiomonas shigelloides]|uniref:gamma-glutamylcyclotransferase family protein n=1 Tax=Plesiomonas shigelloides TaxID=703 RepID=UPI00325FED8A
MKYFAYGSNMSMVRLKKRVPSAERVGMFSLKKHYLAFHKSSKDGSGKCNAYFTGNTKDHIYGALFEIDENEKKALDRAEGLGYGYDEKIVQVEDDGGNTFEAVTYVATSINESLIPYSWYLNHVIVGAQETGVPVSYLEMIKTVATCEDSDKERDKEQREMHR